MTFQKARDGRHVDAGRWSYFLDPRWLLARQMLHPEPIAASGEQLAREMMLLQLLLHLLPLLLYRGCFNLPET